MFVSEAWTGKPRYRKEVPRKPKCSSFLFSCVISCLVTTINSFLYIKEEEIKPTLNSLHLYLFNGQFLSHQQTQKKKIRGDSGLESSQVFPEGDVEISSDAVGQGPDLYWTRIAGAVRGMKQNVISNLGYTGRRTFTSVYLILRQPPGPGGVKRLSVKMSLAVIK